MMEIFIDWDRRQVYKNIDEAVEKEEENYSFDEFLMEKISEDWDGEPSRIFNLGITREELYNEYHDVCIKQVYNNFSSYTIE